MYPFVPSGDTTVQSVLLRHILYYVQNVAQKAKFGCALALQVTMALLLCGRCPSPRVHAFPK